MLKARAAARARKTKSADNLVEQVAEAGEGVAAAALPGASDPEIQSEGRASSAPDLNAEQAAADVGEGGPPTPAALSDSFVLLPHARIRPDPDNARKTFDEDGLNALAASIAAHGLLQPLAVAPADPDGVHPLVFGERRWRAIGLLIKQGRWADDHPVPCRLHLDDALARAEIALIENLQRIDLDHMEMAHAYELLGSRHHLSNKDIAARIHRSPEHVQQHRRLTQLEPKLQDQVRDGDLSLHDAVAILAKPGPKTLGPAVMLALVEIWHRCKTKPLGHSWEEATECAPEAGADGALKQLVERRLVDFTTRDHDTQRAKIRLQYSAFEIIRTAVKGSAIKNDAGPLKSFRAAAGVPGYNPLAADYDPAAGEGKFAYATAWLNGPFTISDGGAKVLADRKAAKEKEKADEIKRQERLKAAELADKVLAEELVALSPAAMPGRLAPLFAELKLAGPFTTDAYGAIKDAGGREVLGVTWRIDDRRRTAAALAAALTWCAATLLAEDAPVPVAETPKSARGLKGLVGDAFSQQLAEARAAPDLEPAE